MKKFYLVTLYNELDPEIIKGGAMRSSFNVAGMLIVANSKKEAVGEAWEDYPDHRIVTIQNVTGFVLDRIKEHDGKFES